MAGLPLLVVCCYITSAVMGKNTKSKFYSIFTSMRNIFSSSSIKGERDVAYHWHRAQADGFPLAVTGRGHLGITSPLYLQISSIYLFIYFAGIQT